MGDTTAKKTLSFVVEASNMTAELLKSVLRAYLAGDTKYKACRRKDGKINTHFLLNTPRTVCYRQGVGAYKLR